MAGVETNEETITSQSTIAEEIDSMKKLHGENCRIIENIGAYSYIIKIKLQDFGVTVKFQITDDYPVTKPTVILTWECSENISLGDGLRSLILTENTVTSMVRTAVLWLRDHSHLLQTENKQSKKKKEKRKRNKASKEEDESKKKPSMKTAVDVISRIQWDDKLEADQFTVGYIDRFLGVVEKSFSVLSWDDLASVDDHEVLAIPKHRIEYFKYKDYKVWDKKSRTDYVFGSSGEKKLTIYDVIDNYHELSETKPEDNDTGSGSYSDSDDDGIEISLNSVSPSVKIDAESDDDDDVDLYWGDKLRPNYFLCVRLYDEGIKSMVDYVQDILISRQPLYDSCCIKLSALHVTLCCMRLNNALQLQDATRALEEFRPDFSRLKTKLTLCGTDTFNSRVLYAKIRHDDKLNKLVDCIKLALRTNGVEILDGQDFVPHMTIMKTSRPVSRQIGREIPKSIYSGSEDIDFGEQELDNLNLCEMGAACGSDGFYITPLTLKL